MRSALPKILHNLGGLPMVSYGVRLANQLTPDPPLLVVGHGAEQVKIWRRSYSTPPPPLLAGDERHASRDPRYAGVDPADAVKVQVSVMYLVLGSVATTTAVMSLGISRELFTPAQQLRRRITPGVRPQE